MAESKMSRRRMLQLTGMSMLGSGMIFAGAGCAKEEEKAPEKTTLKVTVYDPTGSVEVTQTYAKRLDGIDNKTIAFVCNSMWEEERTFALIKEILETKYQGVKVITADNFPNTTQDITVENNGIAEKMKNLNVDAAIVGNAG